MEKNKNHTHKNENISYGMWWNCYKWFNQQGLNLQNIQTTHTTKQQQNIKPNRKMAGDLIDISPLKT